MLLPEEFILRTQALLGSEWPAFAQALEEESPVSIRINTSKTAVRPVPYLVDTLEPVPWASHAYYLTARPSFTLDPLFHAGCYYVQEASSMFLEQILNRQVSRPVKVLDLCAAPGGKSTQLASVLPEGSLLVANEVIRSRAFILAENLIKWGNPNRLITQNDPAAFGALTGFFDVMVADLPCSGEGMFRKDRAAVNEWSVAAVRLCAERQRRIVADVWPALKPGGLLVYSTCTYNNEENNDNVSWICRELGAEMAELPVQFFPHTSKGEGFFVAAVRKDGVPGTRVHGTRCTVQGKGGRVHGERDTREWLSCPDDFVIFQEGNRLTAVPEIHWADYTYLKKYLKIVSAGVTLGEVKGKDRIPAHDLAMSNVLAADAFPGWEPDKATVLKYLRKEALQTLPGDLPQGYVLVMYEGRPLGFVKNIGNRANNLYPQSWRIRMQV
jgi:16S rRNA C967 or C1407 C5-methylase (RsmB/RsmF family)/NOL1/NOP2/fmu family ribosome biogenesis protein